jgi:hypothetical protein
VTEPSSDRLTRLTRDSRISPRSKNKSPPKAQISNNQQWPIEKQKETDITAIMTSWSEDVLIETLSGVLLKDEIEGLDEDLVAYMSGLLSTLLADNPSDCVEILDESMLPFLESVGCPLELIDEAKAAVLSKAVAAMVEPASTGTRKLQQGIVNMSSTLSEQSNEESNRYLWGASDKIKANANTQIDAYQEKTSSKDRRKQKQDLEKTRDELAQQQQQVEQGSTKAGVSSMILPSIKSKEKDVQLQNVTLALDNGTLLMEHGDLKFTYQRRYGLIGENGVGSKYYSSRRMTLEYKCDRSS